jgi:heme-degrading monooxygenase HmoA
MADQYVSGDWSVKAGTEDEFVSRWLDFTGWSKEQAAGARSFVLLRDMEEPQHFVSLGTWDDRDSINAWRSTPEFAEKLGRCRELCEDFRARDFTLAASP